MATTTTNFNFPIPQSTDLVKDGATAIAALGTSVDTQFVDLKGGTTGQVLAKASGTDLDFSWVAQDDSNAIQNTQLTAKGALISAFSAGTPATLTVGNNGETLVADSSTSTGLRYTGLFGANKNRIINGDCFINQRNFSSGTTQGQYVVDRFQDDGNGGTITTSVQQFTAGAAPVAGYEAKQFMRTITATQSTAGNYQSFSQAIEDVRSLAGQTVTVSFWAKAASGTPNIGASLRQDFGSGGSSAVITSAAVQTITTGWVRYSFTINVPSISGKTIGTSSFLKLYIFVSCGTTISGLGYPAVGLQNNTFDIWGVQIEAGSIATPFQTATGTLQGELSACQRYYARFSSDGNTNFDLIGPLGSAGSSTQVYIPFIFPTMRVAPTAVDYANLRLVDQAGGVPAISNITAISNSNPTTTTLEVTTTGATAFRPYVLQANNNATAYVGLSAEL